jgi:hypothetical protein
MITFGYLLDTVAGKRGDPLVLLASTASGGLAVSLLLFLVVRWWTAAASRQLPPRLLSGESAVARGFASTTARGAPRRGCLYLTTRRLVFHYNRRPGSRRAHEMEVDLPKISDVSEVSRFVLGPARALRIGTINASWDYFVENRPTWLIEIERTRGTIVGDVSH